MSNSLLVGDGVRHPEYGIGVIERLIFGGVADVKFDHDGHTLYVEEKLLQKLSLVEQKIRNSRLS
jgi:hypothetical protein